MSLGSLRVLLGLDAAEFTTGLTKAEARLKKTEQQAKSFSRTLQNDIAFGVGKAVTALTALDRVGGFLIRFGFDAINAAASFEDLGEKTGGSAEKLASFQTAADITKTSMESVGEALVKLTKGLAGADEETKGAANAVQKLGFNLAEFKEIDSATQFEQLAKRLNEFADSNTKTSAAVQLFGKAGANQLSLMKELANQTDRSTILTKAHIKAADDFADKQATVTSELKQYVGVVGIAVLPVLTALSKAFVDVMKNMTEMDAQTGTLKASNAVLDWAETAAIAVATLAESLLGLAKTIRAVGGSFQAVAADIEFGVTLAAEGPSALIKRDASKIKAALAERNKIVEEANQRYVDLWNYNGTAVSDALRKSFAMSRALEGEGDSAGDQVSRRFMRIVTKPKLPDWFGGGGGGGKSDKATKAAQEAKKLLDKELSDIDNFIKAEKRIFETRESDLARLYQSDQISIAAYFDERLAALDQNTTATIELYNKQIKAQEAFAAAAKRRKDEPAVIDAEKQIGRIQSEIEDVLHEKQQRKLKLQDDLTQAAGDYADQVSEVRARVLELLGTEEAALQAAKLRFDIQNRSVIKGAKREKDPALEADVAALRKQNDEQTKINNLLKDAGVIEQNLATAQAKLHLERDLGMRDEISTLDLVGKSSVEAAAKLKLIADQYLAIALASNDKQWIANAEAFKQKINEMAAATDILAAKIRQTFVDTGASAIETFLNSIAEGKNVLDSFKAAFTQFANDIIRQINRIAAQKIADSLFKSGSGGGEGGIFSGIADAFVSYIGGLGGQEKGGPVSGRTPYIVGERGPEIFVPRTVAAEATKQIDSLIAQRGKPAEYTDRVKAATVATNLPHLIGAKGPEIFVPKIDGIVIPNDKVNKLSRVLQGRANGGPVVSATPYIVGERGPEIFTPRNAATLGPHEKVVTRLVSSVQPKASQVNMPRVVGARGPELFVPKAAGIIIPHDKVAKLASAFERKASAASGAPATRRREISAPLAAARTIMRDEKIITRYANAPYSRRASGGPVAAHVPYIVGERGREIFIPKPAAVQRDEAVSKLSTALQKQGRGTSASVASRLSAASAAIASRWSGGSATKTSRIIHERVPQIYIQQSATEIRTRAATGLGLPSVIGAHQPTRDLARPALKLAARMGIVPTLTEPSRRAVTELALDVPRQRRVGGGPAVARTPYVVGERGREIFIPKSANAAVQRDEAINKLSKAFQKQGHSGSAATAQATRIVNERQVYIQQSARAIQQSKRAVAELVANAPRQRRAGGGPVAAHTPYVVGELGPELFMPKSAGRIIKHEKAIDDLVSNTIQHRASPVAANVLSEREIFISKLASTNIKNEKFITDLVSNTVQHRASVKNERVQNDLVSNTRNEKIINQIVSNIQRGPFAAHQTYLVGKPELVVRKSEKIIKNESLVSELVTNNVKRNEKIINDLVANSVRRRESAGLAHQTYLVGEHGREIFVPRSARKVIADDKAAVRSPLLERRQHQLANVVSSVQRRAIGGPVAAHQTYLVGERLFMPKFASAIIKNEKVIYDLSGEKRVAENATQFYSDHRTDYHHPTTRPDAARSSLITAHGYSLPSAAAVRLRDSYPVTNLVTNTIHKAQGGPVTARQTYIVGERESELFVTSSAEKIIKNESRVSELVTNNARRNEKVINDLVSKTVHHRESAGAAPNVAAKIIKNESRINELVSNNVQRNEEIINRLVTTTRRESGRSNQLLIVGAHGPELFIPKAAGNIIKNERRINELVSNIEHRNIDRRSEKTIDEIISSTVQHRAKGGPVAAYQTHLVSERGPEMFMGSETNITNNNGLSVPVDFFSNASYHRAMGGPVAANQPYIVGERGPEWFVPKTAGTVVANGKSGGIGNSTFIFNMSGGGNTSRQTQQQLFADAAQAFSRSNRRLN